MEFLLDTANIETIKHLTDFLPISGITSNPSILKKEGNVSFFEHLRQIRNIIGKERSLHVQTVAEDYQGMIKDAKRIVNEIDQDVFIKIPTNLEGLKAIRELKKQGFKITATAIYTTIQADLAIAAGADYIAPYYNRIENIGLSPDQSIHHMAQQIERSQASTKILAASFKNAGQVSKALEAGAQSITAAPDVLTKALKMAEIGQAIADFSSDWSAIHGDGSSISTLK
ncbi:fructose-6-phosphate aldolase [Aerococcus sanguinicola]|uniref:fructose-6-phosphate aldolase n=1 Tax=unclassified Aerococcus TaxID=2618060 RepID=UPI0008A21DAE|nr:MULTISPECIES: fructose-6-phosphate aldolase [unclassified Aerococcus]KAB0645752.1 fructose-6-phosphate aldolase [Aerococcus sanguinicola]MDK6234336.1 fructose-6-phosphate aldolase [Aerococcus sp. UMB10185]MDK6856441.1 fructose-6-phosphate aldolase [Aerococcus sp. UMB7533]OFN01203.1 fructose-bisphosphate aldolase [Aerococcus sp. HMSC062A02]OHO44345.1 fructose-bisphosphate aldolase [Aerococcus sp. HMSC035B07]